MPTRSSRSGSGTKTAADCLIDTSAAIAFVQPDHTGHRDTVKRLATMSMGLAGHAAFETYSVLTRLPVPQRIGAETARRLIERNFPHSRFLSADRSAELLVEFTSLGIAGGSVYDALVGSAAREHDLPLISRDRRAAETYHRLGVDAELI